MLMKKKVNNIINTLPPPFLEAHTSLLDKESKKLKNKRSYAQQWHTSSQNSFLLTLQQNQLRLTSCCSASQGGHRQLHTVCTMQKSVVFGDARGPSSEGDQGEPTKVAVHTAVAAPIPIKCCCQNKPSYTNKIPSKCNCNAAQLLRILYSKTIRTLAQTWVLDHSGNHTSQETVLQPTSQIRKNSKA